MHHCEQTRHPRMAVKPAAGTDFGDLYTPPGSIAAVGDGCGAAHDVLGAIRKVVPHDDENVFRFLLLVKLRSCHSYLLAKTPFL